jgi:DNA repair exonuclease SbcCD ATPase subunit
VKLERLEITGFGRLQQRRFDFGERVTVILGANESGKTTMHRAVRAALYGLEAGGPGHPRERSEWARWLPWAAGRYGVVLTYRLDSGQRFRVAQSFDRGKIRAQVQEVGGGDITNQFRVGRLVSPGRFHLGVEESVFCAAAWVSEEGLRLGAPDAAPQQAGHLREALERLVDSGPDGVTAAEAVGRLTTALDRVGSERRGTSPLGVATAQLRRLESDIDQARRRLDAFAAEEERLRHLEAVAAESEEAARTAERSWLIGRIAQLGAQAHDVTEADSDVAALTAALHAEAPYAAFRTDDEERVITLGAELHQAERTAEEAEARRRAADGPLDDVRRRRVEIAAGLRAMPRPAPGAEAAGEAAGELRQRLAVAAAIDRRGDDLTAATARDDALRREIAATGLGAIEPTSLDEVARDIQTARTGARRWHALAETGAVALVLGGSASAALATAGRGGPALALAIAVAALVIALVASAAVAHGRAARARDGLARRLAGLDLGADGLDRLAAGLPRVRRLHQERLDLETIFAGHRAELERARQGLEEAVDRCHALALEAGAAVPTRPPRGSRPEVLLESAGAALDAVDEAARQARRRRELDAEDTRLATREAELAELGEEAHRRREEVASVEAGIRQVAAAAGIDAGLPPLAAVAAFREACSHRHEHDRLAASLAEAHRRRRIGGDAGVIDRRRAELEAELRRRGTALEAASVPLPPEAAELVELERAAVSAQQRAAIARSESQTLGARLEGLTAGLPSLADLEDERLAVSAARDRALHQQEALRQATEMIEAAGRGVHGRVAPRLAASVSERLAFLTGDRYGEANVDIEHFAVSLASAEREGLVPLDLVSHGTRDQVALLLRLALCEVLGDGGESMPLLLDDPLGSADPERRQSLLKFLAQLSTTNQVVLTVSDRGVAATLLAVCDPATSSVIDVDADTDSVAVLAPELEV